MKTVSNYVADYLQNIGVEHVFMIVGGGAMYLNDSLGKKFKSICFHHEQACTIAADAYARIHNKIPIVNVTTGPGGTNAVSGVLGAWTDSIPMLIISGQVAYKHTVQSTGMKLRQLGDQEFDIISMVSHITKYAHMITDPADIKFHLDKAIYEACNGRPGPCWLDIPLDIQNAQIEENQLRSYIPNSSIPIISNDAIHFTLNCLKNAKRPVVLAGGGIRCSKSVGIFNNLINKLKVPVLTAFGYHDIIESSHPLCIGRPGTLGERGGNFILQNADVLLVLGSRLDIRQIGYKDQSLAPNAIKIMIDIDENELKKPTLDMDVLIHGDLKDFINKLSKCCDDLEPKNDWLEWCRIMSRKYPIVLPEYRKECPINPYGFVEEIDKQLEEEQIIVCANGTACVIPFQILSIKKGQRLIGNTGTASMGWELPASIGAYFASNKKIVCFAGDGSIQMNLQELQTIKYHNLPIKIFLLNNDGYLSIRQTQTNNKIGPIGFDNTCGVSFPSMEKIAFAYGIKYLKCINYSEIQSVFKQTMSGQEPTICEVILDRNQGFSPRIVAKKENGKMVPCSLEDMYPFLDEKEIENNKCIN
jgi:acetolactate synthase I/II/III large subunit